MCIHVQLRQVYIKHRIQEIYNLPGAPEVQPAKSGIMVPMVVQNAAIGLIGVETHEQNRTWTREEISLVESIARQMAEAAENLRLVDETQRRAAREAKVNEISEKIQAAQSIEEALQIAAKEVGLSLQAPRAVAQLQVK